MKVTCIESGSSGNCFYVEFTDGTGIFLDAGVHPDKIIDLAITIAGKPVFITHEHGDHAKYAKILRDHFSCTIHGTRGTLNALGIKRSSIPPGMSMMTVPVLHNAADPCLFYIGYRSESLLYIMDAGQIPDLGWARPNVLICEANYTPKKMAEMAEASASGLYVSGRVSSGFGHLSVNQTAMLARPMLRSLELLILAHVSKKNFAMDEYLNDPNITDAFKLKARFAEPGRTWSTIPF